MADKNDSIFLSNLFYNLAAILTLFVIFVSLNITAKLLKSNEDNKKSNKIKDGNYFDDQKRVVDFIIIYEEKEEIINLSLKDEYLIMQRYRDTFLNKLKEAGVEIEDDISVNTHNIKVHFIKIHIPWNVLIDYAEDLDLRVPLKYQHSVYEVNVSHDVLQFFRIHNPMRETVPKKPLAIHTCQFKKAKLNKLLGLKNKDDLFTVGQRITVANEILERTVFGQREIGEVGITRLIQEGVFTAAYPLHDGDFQKFPNDVEAFMNKRQILREYWAQYKKWYKYQPIEHIREYFGEQVAMYFAWLGFYTTFLLPAALAGIFAFFYGVFTVAADEPSSDVCNGVITDWMCPLCANCDPWNITEICAYSKLSYLFDNPGTVFVSIFMSFWALIFTILWKRQCVTLTHLWDSMNIQDDEKPRPEFAAKAPLVAPNPITGVNEPTFPPKVRLKRMLAGLVAIFCLTMMVIIFMVAVIIYRVLLYFHLGGSVDMLDTCLVSGSAASLNLIIIIPFGMFYEKIAYRLTEWEMHRTQTEFDHQLTLKISIFQLINYYSSIFYVAFFKGKFSERPGTYPFGYMTENCYAGCMSELAQQLIIIMIGKQIVNNIMEVLLPKMLNWYYKRDIVSTVDGPNNQWVSDYKLPEYEGLFQEYLEMALQFGFITFFVAAFPLAPLFALLNNWVEIRLDAVKMVCDRRRPVPRRCQDIGVWLPILSTIAHLSVICNAMLIAFTSDFLPRLLYRFEYGMELKGFTNFSLAYYYINNNTDLNSNLNITHCRYRGFIDDNGDYTMFHWKLTVLRFGFVILFEHLVFFICNIFDHFFPKVADEVAIIIRRERYLAKTTLSDVDHIVGTTEAKDESSPTSPNEKKSGPEK